MEITTYAIATKRVDLTSDGSKVTGHESERLLPTSNRHNINDESRVGAESHSDP